MQGQGEHVLRGKISALIIFISYYSLTYPSGKVIFPVPAGEPCENCLHCLTEMGIGVKMNSIVSVIPTQCTYSGIGGIGATSIKDDLARRRKESEERNNAWKAFVESIRSKLTVKQVVDGVRSGGDLMFDYVLLVLTAE